MDMEAFSNNLFPIVQGPTARYAQWPPVVSSVQNLGYLVDQNGENYPRDIGRSSSLAGHIIFLFGDTFAHDQHGNLIASASSTSALVQDPETTPTVTSYSFDEDGHVRRFLLPLPEEVSMLRKRATLWCFGGIIELGEQDGGVAAGWVYYQKGTHYYYPKDEYKFEYTGVAKIYYDIPSKSLRINRMDSPLALFKENEPRFGTFSTLTQGDQAYVFGHAHESWKVMLARVHTRSVLDRSQYRYWDGKKYQPELDEAKEVMDDVQHGAIYRSKLFEPNKGRDWVFVGCSRFRDNQLLFGVSANMEGPYTTISLMSTFPLPPMPEEPFRYCIYPHPWAFKEEKGQLMITWSEGSANGNVVAVMVQFAMTMDFGRPSRAMSKDSSIKRSCCIIM